MARASWYVARERACICHIDDEPGFLEEPPRATDCGAEDLTARGGDGDLAGQRIDFAPAASGGSRSGPANVPRAD